jgi:exodeoxyribonuclease VII large subunit
VTLTDLAADVRAATPSQAAELVVGRRAELVNELASCRRHLAGALRGKLETARAALAEAAGAEGLGGFPSRVQHERLSADSTRRALFASVRGLPAAYGERLGRAEQRVLAWPSRAALPHVAKDVDASIRRVMDRVNALLSEAKERVGGASGRLSALDPLAILARGYSVAYAKGAAAPLTSAADVAPGDEVRVLLAKGELDARVTAARPDGGLAAREREP